MQTLVREIREELDVAIAPGSASHVGTFEAQAHGHAAGITVRMTCYAAEYSGTLAASSEIAELAWLCYADRDRVSAVDQIIFDHLHGAGQLAGGPPRSGRQWLVQPPSTGSTAPVM